MALLPESAGSGIGDGQLSQISPLTPLPKEPSTSTTQMEGARSKEGTPKPTTPVESADADEEDREEGVDEGKDVNEEGEHEEEVDEGIAEQTTSHGGNESDQASRESTPVLRTRRRGALFNFPKDYDSRAGDTVHKRGASEAEADAYDSSREKKRLRDESEPMDDADSPATTSAVSGSKSSKGLHSRAEIK